MEIFARSPEGKASKHLCETHDGGQRFSSNVIERLNGAVRDHPVAARRIGEVTSETVRRYVNFYNYLRPHMGLGGYTFMERAGIVIKGDDKLLTVIQNATKFAREDRGPPGA